MRDFNKINLRMCITRITFDLSKRNNMKNSKFKKGQIVKNAIDTVINYEIKRIISNNCVGGFNLICRSFSKYGEHGIVEIHESNVIN